MCMIWCPCDEKKVKGENYILGIGGKGETYQLVCSVFVTYFKLWNLSVNDLAVYMFYTVTRKVMGVCQDEFNELKIVGEFYTLTHLSSWQSNQSIT